MEHKMFLDYGKIHALELIPCYEDYWSDVRFAYFVLENYNKLLESDNRLPLDGISKELFLIGAIESYPQLLDSKEDNECLWLIFDTYLNYNQVESFVSGVWLKTKVVSHIKIDDKFIYLLK